MPIFLQTVASMQSILVKYQNSASGANPERPYNEVRNSASHFNVVDEKSTHYRCSWLYGHQLRRVTTKDIVQAKRGTVHDMDISFGKNWDVTTIDGICVINPRGL